MDLPIPDVNQYIAYVTKAYGFGRFTVVELTPYGVGETHTVSARSMRSLGGKVIIGSVVICENPRADDVNGFRIGSSRDKSVDIHMLTYLYQSNHIDWLIDDELINRQSINIAEALLRGETISASDANIGFYFDHQTVVDNDDDLLNLGSTNRSTTNNLLLSREFELL